MCTRAGFLCPAGLRQARVDRRALPRPLGSVAPVPWGAAHEAALLQERLPGSTPRPCRAWMAGRVPRRRVPARRSRPRRPRAPLRPRLARQRPAAPRAPAAWPWPRRRSPTRSRARPALLPTRLHVPRRAARRMRPHLPRRRAAPAPASSDAAFLIGSRLHVPHAPGATGSRRAARRAAAKRDLCGGSTLPWRQRGHGAVLCDSAAERAMSSRPRPADCSVPRGASLAAVWQAHAESAHH